MVQIQFHEYGLLAHDSQLPPPLLLLTIYRLSQSVLWDSLAQSYLRIMDHIILMTCQVVQQIHHPPLLALFEVFRNTWSHHHRTGEWTVLLVMAGKHIFPRAPWGCQFEGRKAGLLQQKNVHVINSVLGRLRPRRLQDHDKPTRWSWKIDNLLPSPLKANAAEEVEVWIYPMLRLMSSPDGVKQLRERFVCRSINRGTLGGKYKTYFMLTQ